MPLIWPKIQARVHLKKCSVLTRVRHLENCIGLYSRPSCDVISLHHGCSIVVGRSAAVARQYNVTRRSQDLNARHNRDCKHLSDDGGGGPTLIFFYVLVETVLMLSTEVLSHQASRGWLSHDPCRFSISGGRTGQAFGVDLEISSSL